MAAVTQEPGDLLTISKAMPALARFLVAHFLMAASVLLTTQIASAGPLIPPGDAILRHDIQLLADHGIVTGPVTSWPLTWAAIAADIERVDAGSHSPQVAGALSRVRGKMRRAAGNGGLRYRTRASAAAAPTRIRGFADTPRESGEIGLGLSWTGGRISLELNGQLAGSPDDDRKYRADGSRVGMTLGNFGVAASTMDRWWGPGWDGSLILSGNARPIPAVTLDRHVTHPFASKWLSWLGPWDVSAVFGQLETDRAVPDAWMFGLRFNFRPLPSLEIGLSRTAQWCGEDRPCDVGTFADLLFGRDNRGDDGIGGDNEPGNQLAGADFRWSAAGLGLPLALYGQFIGEDEAGGLPSRYLGQLGIETSGAWRDEWSYRVFGEIADTRCGFYDSDGSFNCAYNHSIYSTGYRYRGRAIGHGSDNDARIFSGGLLLVDGNDTRWQVLLRYGDLNRGGWPDERHTLTETAQHLESLDVSHRRSFRFGIVEIGAGLERIDDRASQRSDNEVRAYIQWRSGL